MRGMEESNPRQCFWRALLYHLTNPPYSVFIVYDFSILGKKKPRTKKIRDALCMSNESIKQSLDNRPLHRSYR
jgi:hypothetical protein